MNNIDYVNGALRTEAPITEDLIKRFINPETAVLLLSAIRSAISAGQEMDKLKRHLFYNQSLSTFGSREHTVPGWALGRLGEPGIIRLLHAAMGLVTESAELCEALHKHIDGGEPLPNVNLIEEAGDQFWYLAILADALSVTFEDIMTRNNRKLRARYPEQFSVAKATERDLPAERVKLETEDPC